MILARFLPAWFERGLRRLQPRAVVRLRCQTIRMEI